MKAVSKEWVAIIINFLLVIATLVYVFITWCQLQTSMKSDRAWLIIPTMSFAAGSFTPPSPVIVTIDVRNHGKLPAHIVGLEVDAHVGVDLPPQPAYGGQEEKLNLAVPPNTSESMRRVLYSKQEKVSPPWVLDKVTVNAVEAGKMWLWVFGYVRYRDNPNLPSHVIGFCLRYVPKRFEGAQGSASICGSESYEYERDDRP